MICNTGVWIILRLLRIIPGCVDSCKCCNTQLSTNNIDAFYGQRLSYRAGMVRARQVSRNRDAWEQSFHALYGPRIRFIVIHPRFNTIHKLLDVQPLQAHSGSLFPLKIVASSNLLVEFCAPFFTTSS